MQASDTNLRRNLRPHSNNALMHPSDATLHTILSHTLRSKCSSSGRASVFGLLSCIIYLFWFSSSGSGRAVSVIQTLSCTPQRVSCSTCGLLEHVATKQCPPPMHSSCAFSGCTAACITCIHALWPNTQLFADRFFRAL